MVFWLSYNLTATPKSANLTSPLFVSKIFAPFISLWITYCLCKKTRPLRICFMYILVTSSWIGDFLTSEASDPPYMYYKIKYILFYFWIASINFTMYGWSSFLSSYSYVLMAFASDFPINISLIATKDPFVILSPL